LGERFGDWVAGDLVFLFFTKKRKAGGVLKMVVVAFAFLRGRRGEMGKGR